MLELVSSRSFEKPLHPLTSTTDKAKAAAQFEKLVKALANVGLATEVRNGEKQSLLVFVKVASEEHLFGEVYRSRYGI